VHATARLPMEVASPIVDLAPPVRAEAIDLLALVSHRTATPSSASVERVSEIFSNGTANFVAVLKGESLRGMCSRQETVALLGGRYGFAVCARKPIGEHLCQYDTQIKIGTPIGTVLSLVFARPNENFYDILKELDIDISGNRIQSVFDRHQRMAHYAKL